LLAAAPLICLDPGHGTPPAIGRQTEPIGPGSSIRKIKDGGGAPGETPVALAIGLKTRALLEGDGLRVAMTRTGPTTTLGNVARARFCNLRHAALMIRIHADGAADSSLHGIQMLYPAWHRGWTDDIYSGSLRAARVVQGAVVRTTQATDLGLMPRSDLTGFNWANVPAILVESGFMTNPRESRLLRSGAYQWKVARGLAIGAASFAKRGGQCRSGRSASQFDSRSRPRVRRQTRACASAAAQHAARDAATPDFAPISRRPRWKTNSNPW